jgi:hypothetical protein
VSGVGELVAFVMRCVDKDERVALAAIQEHSDPSGRWALGGDIDDNVRPADPTGNDWVAVGPWDGGLGDATAAHIARWDPARALAEVKAKRRILDLHHETELESEPDHEPLGAGCAECAHFDWPCDTIRLLAQPYAGQDGWQEEWRT